MSRPIRSITLALFLIIALFACAPLLVVAQSDLRSEIRAELLSDPRTSGLSSAQIDAMVDLLAEEAQRQGMTVEDIHWRPQTFSSGQNGVAQENSCAASAFLCMFNEAFGFAGNDPTIPFVLGAGSMGLVWIIAEKLHRRRMGLPH